MKLGIMQPYFFPYIGYFQLIKSVDRFVFFDTPQYEKRSWMNRNRIINLKEGSTYITVPTVKTPRETPINRVCIDYQQPWVEKILGQLTVYQKLAPNYNRVIDLVRGVICEKYDSIAELNIASIVASCQYLGIPLAYDVFSEMDLGLPQKCAADEWALHITQKMNYDEYVNAPGGESFFDKKKYTSANIKLDFIQPRLREYVQKIGRFEGALSIIDVMMFNDQDILAKMLSDFSLKM